MLVRTVVIAATGRRETVNEALREFIQRRRRVELAKLFGKVKYEPRYDYKKERNG